MALTSETATAPAVQARGGPFRASLLYLITVDWFFASHFLGRAVAARDAGYDVLVLTQCDAHAESCREAGLKVLHWDVERSGLNPIRELRALHQVIRAYRAYRPDLVHHIALKPIIYGSLAALICGVRRSVNAPVGMGFAFSSTSLLARALRPTIRLALRALLNPRGSCVVFENRDDLGAAVADGLVRAADAVLIRGAGIDIDEILPTPEPAGRVRVVLLARMLWDKGVGEFVAAARRLRGLGVEAEFVLIGGRDPHNRACIATAQLEDWRTEGVIDWLGQRDDVPALLAASHLVVLPSYREGLPKALLEALAAGRPVVATDVPGCREVVIPDENGLLVPPRDPDALADAMARLIRDPELRRRYGEAGRRLAEREFSAKRVERETLRLYDALLSPTNICAEERG
jgi:glycosyltransferase involved in cell wall biosynthesis